MVNKNPNIPKPISPMAIKAEEMNRIQNLSGAVMAFKVSPDESLLVMGGNDHILIKNMWTGEDIGPGRISLANSGIVTTVSFSPDGNLFVVGSHDGKSII